MSWREILSVEPSAGKLAQEYLQTLSRTTSKTNFADSAVIAREGATLLSALDATEAVSVPEAQSEIEPPQTPHNESHDSNFADSADIAEGRAPLQSASKPTRLESSPGNRSVSKRNSLRFLLQYGGGTILGEAGETADDLLQTLIEKWPDELLSVMDDGVELYQQS